MSCRKATRLISEGMNRPLTGGERVSLRWHLFVCTACRRYQKQLLLISNALRSLAGRIDAIAAETEPLPAAARERIAEAIGRRL